jgi:hypothetical protein
MLAFSPNEFFLLIEDAPNAGLPQAVESTAGARCTLKSKC